MSPEEHYSTCFTRREFLQRSTAGLGMIGLAGLMQSAGLTPLDAAIEKATPSLGKLPHFAPKAKRIVHIFHNGGLSHIDSFDPKPLLRKYDGQTLPKNFRTERRTGAAMASPWEFKKYGQSGIEVSDLFSEIGSCIDDICVIRSMHTNVPNHGPSLLMMNCGSSQLARPSLGSWLNYGLGSENENLPGFVVLCPGGMPLLGAKNWRSAFLPSTFQATHIDTSHKDINKLIAHLKNQTTPRDAQRVQLDLLKELNQQHQSKRPGDSALDARLESFELAYRMQMEASDALDLNQESQYTKEAYGDTKHGRQFILARRMLERGVRCVQVWHGAGQPWDSHDSIIKNHGKLAGEIDRPIAAFLRDLKQRGMLEDTLVVCTGEFGRTPTAELGDKDSTGRDHNPYGFSAWLAGGGVKGGHVHGATDEFGFEAIKDKVHVHDLHATILHLMGINHEAFTYRYAGRDFRLTDVHGKVVEEILA